MNQMPYMQPINPQMNQPINSIGGPSPSCKMEFDRINNRLNRMERQIRILEAKVANLEGNHQKIMPLNSQNDNYQSDMYMI